MKALYRPGTSAIHRMPAGAKLAFLAVSALALSLLPVGAIGTAIVLFVVCALYPLAGMPLSVLWAESWRLRWLVLVLAGMLLIFTSPEAAWNNTGRVVALLLLAALLTLTTRMAELQQTLTRMLRPFERFGVNADAVSMTISLTITMIPVVAGFADRVREAQQARGVRLGVRAVVPLLVMALKHADDVGDALAARGLA